MRVRVEWVRSQFNSPKRFVLSPQYRAKLEASTKLIERHQLRPVIDSVLSWDQVVLAHQHLEQGGTRGKIVLKFTEN
nr:zinc-binding dehydrogenase [Nostoc sp. FACHB-888]